MNDLPTYNGMPPLTPHKPTSLTDALRSGQQCNEDGVMCIVSRQACHEAADEIEASQARIAELEAALTEIACFEPANPFEDMECQAMARAAIKPKP
jgi:hypothetical protein